MANYVGIDLGTTNSAICSYDGENLKLYKSPEQHSVTPSALYIDKRSRYYGAKAYRMAAYAKDNTATLFKRLMGTSTMIKLSAAGATLTPEECSAEILRVLYGYLPEEIRNSQDTGTVITVPAAFNQMQKDATMSAAALAGIGNVALMQEPVAAVMSVMRKRKNDGMFLVYDIGGGTFDVAIAESISGRVSLIANGGIEMCGGRDFDRSIVDNMVKPWLLNTFNLPEDFSVNAKYSQLTRLAAWASEQAKIELSFNKEETNIYLSDAEIRMKDENGEDIYFDIPFNRTTLNKLIDSKIIDSIEATKELLEKSNLTTHDIERIVFVGGPTQYKPLRDKVCFELGIPGNTDVDPMTAVAEGAAVFAESIDWQSANRGRKSGRGTLSTKGSVSVDFRYQSRTPDLYSLLVVKVTGNITSNATWQVDSLDSGWSSGRVELVDSKSIKLPLGKYGENVFKVFLYDGYGGALPLDNDIISIARTTATIDAIPASHSIKVAVKEKSGGKILLDPLVTAGTPLPHKGQTTFRAEETLRANGPGQIAITLWEGEIEEPYYDNRQIGTIKITGKDFDEGVILPNAEIVCDYEILDSGAITISVTVPSIGATFNKHNFYSRQEGQLDYTNAARQIEDETEKLLDRIESVSTKISDIRLQQVQQLLEESRRAVESNSDPEVCKQAMDNTLTAKKILSKITKDNRKIIRQTALEGLEEFFEQHIREIAKPSEVTAFESLFRSARRTIDNGSGDFENSLDEIRNLNWVVLWRQDWFVVERFNQCQKQEYMYTDKALYMELIHAGRAAVKSDDIDKLRSIVGQLGSIRIHSDIDNIADIVNIIRG